MAIVDIAAGNFFARALHQFQFHLVLDVLDAHLTAASLTDAVGNALNQAFVLTSLGGEHGFAYRCLDFFLVIADNATVTFKNSLNHFCLSKS